MGSQAVRAPGSKVTSAPETRDSSAAANSGSMRTVPVNHSAGPFTEACEPLRLISIFLNLCIRDESNRWAIAITQHGSSHAIGAAAIHRQGVAGDVAGFVRGEEEHRVREFFERSEAIEHNRFDSVRYVLGHFFGVRVELVIGVTNVPGATQLTLMPCGPSSRASVFVNWMTPALAEA